MVKMNQLGITRRQLDSWASECGLMLVSKPEQPLEDMSAAQADDYARFNGEMKVYFVQESGTGAVKIGTSKQLRNRLAELSRILPYEIKLLAAVDGGRETEWTIHNRFEQARIRGEWFRPVPELLAYIDEIKSQKEDS